MCLNIHKLFLFIPSNLIRLTLRGGHHIQILQMKEWRLRELKLLIESHVANNSRTNSFSLIFWFYFSKTPCLLLTSDRHKGERFVSFGEFPKF